MPSDYNLFHEQLLDARPKLTTAEWRLAVAIGRMTLGYHGHSTEIGQTYLMQKSGLPDRRSFVRARQSLIDRGLIIYQVGKPGRGHRSWYMLTLEEKGAEERPIAGVEKGAEKPLHEPISAEGKKALDDSMKGRSDAPERALQGAHVVVTSKESPKESNNPPTPLSGGSDDVDQDNFSISEVDRCVRLIYGHWREVRDKTDERYDQISNHRWETIHDRLVDGFTIFELYRAIDAVYLDPYEHRHVHDDLTKIFSTSKKVDFFLNLADEYGIGKYQWSSVRSDDMEEEDERQEEDDDEHLRTVSHVAWRGGVITTGEHVSLQRLDALYDRVEPQQAGLGEAAA